MEISHERAGEIAEALLQHEMEEGGIHLDPKRQTTWVSRMGIGHVRQADH